MIKFMTIVYLVDEESGYKQENVENFPFEGKLNDFLGYLKRIQESAPVEYRDNLYIDIGATGDRDEYYKPTVEIYYQRPETAEEFQERSDKERERTEREAERLRVLYVKAQKDLEILNGPKKGAD